MEDLVASRVDAIIIAAISGPGTVGAVEAAVAAGIPVVSVNVMTDSDKVVTRIRSDDDVIGRMQGDFMGDRLKGAGNVVMLRGAPGTSWAEIRGNAFRKEIAAKYPNVKVVGEQYSQSTPADGLRLMEDFLQTYPQISGVYNGADSTAVGAAQAVKSAGKAGSIVMTATDFQVDTEKFIRDGVITETVLLQALQVPVVLAEMLHQLRIGHQVEVNRLRFPRPRVGLRIVDLDFELHLPETDTAEALGRLQRLGVRMPVVIEPAAFLEARG